MPSFFVVSGLQRDAETTQPTHMTTLDSKFSALAVGCGCCPRRIPAFPACIVVGEPKPKKKKKLPRKQYALVLTPRGLTSFLSFIVSLSESYSQLPPHRPCSNCSKVPIVNMPAFDSHKVVLSGTTTLNASSTVFQPSRNAKLDSTSVSPLGSSDGNARQQHQSLGLSHSYRHQSKGYYHNNKRSQKYSKNSSYDYQSTSMLKVHDELPIQALQAWERYLSERLSETNPL